MKSLVAMIIIAALGIATQVTAAEIKVQEKTTYYTLRGETVDALRREINRIGPFDPVAKARSASKTDVSFYRDLDLATQNGMCRLIVKDMRLGLTFTEPKWRPSGRRDARATSFFLTLSSDIQAFQNDQSKIARTAIRRLDAALRGLRPQRSCGTVSERVSEILNVQLERHRKEQIALIRRWSQKFEGRR